METHKLVLYLILIKMQVNAGRDDKRFKNTHAHTHMCTYIHAHTHTHTCTYTHRVVTFQVTNDTNRKDAEENAGLGFVC